MQLSYSKVNTLLQCPRKYRYRYLDKLATPTPGRLIQGSAYHKGVAQAFYRKQTVNEIMNGEEVAEAVSAAFNNAVEKNGVPASEDDEPDILAKYFEGIDWGEDDPGKLKDEAIDLATHYCKEFLPQIEPYEIEKRWVSDIGGGIVLIGYPDIVGNYTQQPGEKLIDHKLKGRTMGDNEVTKDLQPGMYALIKGAPVDFEFHCLIRENKNKKQKNTGPRIDIKQTARNEDEIAWTKDLVMEVARQIEAGIFPPNPASNLCSETFCEFYDTCHFPASF